MMDYAGLRPGHVQTEEIVWTGYMYKCTYFVSDVLVHIHNP